MRQALQRYGILRGHLNLSKQLVRAGLSSFQNLSANANQALQEALYEELISQIQFFGISNVARFLAELEKDFASRNEFEDQNRAVSNIYNNAETERILHAPCRIQNISLCLVDLRSAKTLCFDRTFAAKSKRKGCEGSREARAEFGEAERAATEVEPAAARSPGRRSRTGDSPLKRTEQWPVGEHRMCEPPQRSAQQVQRARPGCCVVTMQVQAKVKVFEEYRRMLDEFAFQIQLQNDAIAQQTAAAAMAQGFAPSGAGFVKMSNASGAVGFVNAYAYFEAEQIIADELKKIGFEQREGDDLVDFLSQKDDVEVEAYFYTQRLALQHVFSVIMGEGDSEERKESQDERVIGKFGTWAGRQGGNTLTQAVDQVAGDFKSVQQLQDPNMMSLVRNFGGFGEQGAMGFRPGGASLGFYPQLELMNRIMGNADSAEFQELGSSIDPVSAMLNQFNPIVMTMNSYMNVELGASAGKSRGYMWEAQMLSVTKQAITAVGSGLIAVSPFLGPLGLITGAIGAGLSLLGGSMQVNPTTGERHTKLNDQAALNTGVQVATTVGTLGMSLPAQVAIAAGTAVASGGVQYNGEGQISGYSLSGKAGTAALVSGVVAGGAAAAGGALRGGGEIKTFGEALGNSVLSDAISTPLNVLGEYYKQQNLGAQYSNYSTLARPDLSVLGKYAGIGLNYGLAGKIKAMDNNLQAQEQRALDAAQRANQEGQRGAALSILAGLGYGEDRRRRQLELFDQSDRTGGQLKAGKASSLLGGVTQRFGNLFKTGNFKTDNQLVDSLFERLVPAGMDYNVLNDGEFAFFKQQMESRFSINREAGKALLMNQRMNLSPEAAKLQMEYAGMNPVMARGPIAENYRFAREMRETRAEAERLKQQRLQEKVVQQAQEVAAGGGLPQEFAQNFYRLLTGNSMSSVPVHYTAEQRLQSYSVGVNQYVYNRLVGPAASQMLGGVVGLGAYTSTVEYFGFNAFDSFGLKDDGMQGLRPPQIAETRALANTFERVGVTIGELATLQFAGAPLKAAAREGAKYAASYAGTRLGRLYNSFGGNYGVASGVINAVHNVGIEQLFHSEVDLLSSQTAITAGSAFAVGMLASQRSFESLPLGGVAAGTIGLTSSIASQNINAYIDPTYKFSEMQALMSGVSAGATHAGGVTLTKTLESNFGMGRLGAYAESTFVTQSASLWFSTLTAGLSKRFGW